MNDSARPDSGPADWRRAIEELEEQSRQAFLAQDTDRLKLLWSEELVVNSPVNRVLDRNQVFDLLRKGVIRHASYEQHIEITRRQVDVVIVMGHDVVTDAPGAPQVRRRFTNIWHAAGASWRLIARHASIVGQP